MSSNSNYIYVDVTNSVDNVNTKWKRIKVNELKDFQYKSANNFNCFATIQRFSSLNRADEEQYLAPLWLDLDHDDVSIAQLEAIEVVNYFVEDLKIDKDSLRIFYSGKKGFHIIVPEVVMNIKPFDNLHKIYKLIAQYLRKKLQVNNENLTSIDLNVYNKKRMLRLSNSIHQSTKRHKIILTAEELKTFTTDEIISLASQERQIKISKPQYSNEASDFYEFYKEQYKLLESLPKSSDIDEFSFTKDRMPVCVENLYENGWKKDGDRNNTTVNLAIYFRDAKYSQEDANKLLIEWVKKFTSAKTNYEVELRVQSTKNVVQAVYSIESYKFGCAMIRSLHGEKDDDNYERVPCSGLLCEALKTNSKKDNNAKLIHLAQAGSSKYFGKLIKTNIMVAGKKDTPYIVPCKIEYFCYGGCKKKSCPLYSIQGHIAYKNLSCADKELLKMCNIPHNILGTLLKDISGIISCNKYKVNVIETINIYELLIIPMVDKDKEEDDGSYTVRKVFSAGNLDITENKYYQLHGYVLPNPKNQESTILVQKSYPLQDVVDSFEYNNVIAEQLSTFKPVDITTEEIKDKLGQMLHDFTYNVTNIVDRDDILLGVLLVYHSVLKFKVPWDKNAIRGWLETIVIGDTGTGKSHLVDKMQNFIGLGTRVNAESTSRTGLTYKMEQHNNSSWFIQWGAWPLADRELIWIDECSAIPKEEYGHMTLARSEGRLEVKRAVTAETKCRVRSILTGNAPRGKRLTSYTHGIESLVDVFNNEDIRRFDFAMFLRSTDVDPSVYNKDFEEYPIRHTRDALKNNVLFAWSRHIDQVKFGSNTIEAIYKHSTELSVDYGNASIVPIVSPADQRNKVARLAVALAALTNSVQNEHIVVMPAHVEVIHEYLDAIYSSQACGLNYYNKLVIKEEQITEDKFDKIKDFIVFNNPAFRYDNDFNHLIVTFAKQISMNLHDIEAMLNISKENTKTLTQSLVKAGLLIRTNYGFKKTARFNFFINKFCEMGLLENDQLIDIL